MHISKDYKNAYFSSRNVFSIGAQQSVSMLYTNYRIILIWWTIFKTGALRGVIRYFNGAWFDLQTIGWFDMLCVTNFYLTIYNFLFHTGGGRSPVPLDGLWRERPLGPRTGRSVRRPRRSLRAVRQRLPPRSQPPAVRSGGRRSATQPDQLGGHGPVHLHLHQAVFPTTVTENSAAEIKRSRLKMRATGDIYCWILAE